MRMRQCVAAHLKDAQDTAAMSTTFQEVDMGILMDTRIQYKDQFQEKYGVKLGFMSAFLKASTAALKELEGTLALDDMAGGTFTIMEGAIGILMETPIIKPAQSSILGILPRRELL